MNIEVTVFNTQLGGYPYTPSQLPLLNIDRAPKRPPDALGFSHPSPIF